MLDAAHVEHDAYVLFEKLMQFAKPWYEFSESSSGTRSARNSTSVSDITVWIDGLVSKDWLTG